MQIRLKVDGMHCAGCSRAVESVLSKVDQVESAAVDLDAGEALITGSDKVDRAALIAAVDDAGYEAKTLPGN